MSQQYKKKDTTARDITRKLKQIKKYVDELDALGVKQCCVYTSSRTGGLYVYGHEEFASVFKKHQSEAVENVFSADQGHALKESYILPKLPAPVDSINTLTIKSSFATLQGTSIRIGMDQSLSGGHCLFLFRVRGKHRSTKLDANTYLEDNEHQGPEHEVGAEDHPKRDNSISPPQPTINAGTPLHSSTPSPHQPSTPITPLPINHSQLSPPLSAI